MIQPFYKGGTYDKILNENVDTTLFSETFIVFEVDAIKENKKLFPIVTLIIMDVFLQKMRIKKNRKVLIIEEAWKAIASPLMAEYIKFMYKTARKFWASVGVVTQEIQDIIGSEIVKEAIINNSDVVMLLDQSKFRERFDSIQTILGLTDVDCKKIFTINRLENKDGRSYFREVFIRRGTTSGVYGVEEPHECYMTYTTERAEKEALKLYKKELRCNHQDAIEAYCRDWDASGINKSLPFAKKVNEAGKVLNLKPSKNNKTMEKIDISKSVKSIDFGKQYGVRAQRIFQTNGIFTVRDLCRQSKQELVHIRYFSEKSISMIEEILGKYALQLGMTNKELDEYAGIDFQESGNQSNIPIEKDTEADKWEERRYEIAKELFVHQHLSAYNAVTEADSLIKYLKNMPNSN